jgi:hypothetical protein
VYHHDQETIDFLAPHCAFFTWGLNYGNPDCRVPLSPRFPFQPSPPPVVLDFWQGHSEGPAEVFTTVGNWRQHRPELRYQGDVYRWSKHHEFLKFLNLPARSGQAFELALSSCEEEDRVLLRKSGWRVRDALEVSTDPDVYRRYICGSRGEFTVAKDQNIRLRSGWFSERSTQYLAAGRPVINQETGFSNALPIGRGLFAFSNLEEIVEAIHLINADYPGHCRAARELAQEHFAAERVLSDLMKRVGI